MELVFGKIFHKDDIFLWSNHAINCSLSCTFTHKRKLCGLLGYECLKPLNISRICTSRTEEEVWWHELRCCYTSGTSKYLDCYVLSCFGKRQYLWKEREPFFRQAGFCIRKFLKMTLLRGWLFEICYENRETYSDFNNVNMTLWQNAPPPQEKLKNKTL